MLALTFDLSAFWSLIGKVHPVLVHFPVALITVGGLLELWEWRKKRGPSREGILLLRIGALAAIVSALSGWSFAETQTASDNLFLHRWGGIALAVLATFATFLSRSGFPARAYRPLAIALVPLVGAVGHLGGELSWGEGYLLNAVKKVFIESGPESLPVATASLTPEEQHFVDAVWPIFRDRCLECHGEQKQKGDLRLDRREVILAADGIIVEGNPEQSDLIFLVRSDFEEERMPPVEKGPALTETQIQALEKWIRDGTPWPAGALPAAPPVETGFRSGLFGDLFPVAHAAENDRAEPTPGELFRDVVRPTLEKRCTRCHGEQKQKSKLRLDQPDNVFDPDRSERIVVPHDAAASALFERISLPADDLDIMPPEGDPLTKDEITAIEMWINGGAPWESVDADAGSESEPPAARATAMSTPDSVNYLAEVLYRASIEPVLVERCAGCHGPQKQNGKFRVDEASSLLARVVPGDPASSELMRRVALPAGAEDHMPRNGRPLTPLEQEALSAWISAGAPSPGRHAATGELGKENGEGRDRRERLRPQISAPGAVSDPKITLDAETTRQVEATLDALNEVGVRAARVSLAGSEVEVSTALLRDRATDALIGKLTGLEPALIRLDLSGSAITDRGVEGLAAFRELRVLNLSRSAIGNPALPTIARLPALEVLNLHGTAIGDNGIAALHTHPTLRRIYLWQTAVTDAGVEALEKARPELRVIR